MDVRFLEERFLWRRPPAIVEAEAGATGAAAEAIAGAAAEAIAGAGAAAEAPEDPNKVPSPLAIEPNILGAAAAGAAAAGAAAGAAIDEFLLEFLLELLATALGRAVVGAIEVARMALDPIELAVDPKELAAVDILYSITIFCTNPLG